VETAVAWRDAVERRDGPTCLALTRQGVPHQARGQDTLGAIRRGGYVLRDGGGTPELVLVATGSEVALAVGAAEVLAGEGRSVRVVSMPCVELFEAQPAEWRESVLPAAVTARVVIEAGVTATWWRIAGPAGRVIGIDRFGESAPAKQLFEHFGFTVDNVVRVAKELLP
jgi:transketolase